MRECLDAIISVFSDYMIRAIGNMETLDKSTEIRELANAMEILVDARNRLEPNMPFTDFIEKDRQERRKRHDKL